MNFPILSSLILLPIVGALFLFFTKDKEGNNLTAKYVALFTTVVNFLISIYLWISFDQSTSSFQFVEDRVWIEGFINYKVGVDGISILFIILTTFITPICIISVNNSVKNRLRDFLIAILIMESFMIGVFCALDLVVFYLFFEAGLIPMFLIIGIWGGARRVYSAFKFFLYTLLGSVLMLVAIISIYWITGTTDVVQLYEIGIDVKYQNLLWLAFFSSFAVKTPMWPVHTWLPDAHVEAPTAGSVLLAAILLKMAGYGFIRFSLGLFPIASEVFTPLIYTLSVIAIIFISGHFSNFELMAMQIDKIGIKIGAIYRPLNNIFLNKFMERIRKKYICNNQIKKGIGGLKELIKLNNQGFSTALMIDQRVSQGIKSNFFNEKAFTTTIPAQLIKKFNMPIVPIFIERYEGVKFKMKVLKPIHFSNEDTIENITNELNKILEKMILANPNNWIWSHNRWK